MNDELDKIVREHFRSWSGGFPPESEMEIFVYVEYGCGVEDSEGAMRILRQWMDEEERMFMEEEVEVADEPIISTSPVEERSTTSDSSLADVHTEVHRHKSM